MGGRKHSTYGPENSGGLLHTRDEVAGREHERGYEQVAEGVTGEQTGCETMLQGVAERRRLGQQGADTASEVAGSGYAEQLTEPTARAAVVGNRNHGRQIAGIQSCRLECLGEPMATADRNNFRGAGGPLAQRSMSR